MPAAPTPRIQVGLSLMPEEPFRVAAEPLFASGVVDALEWSFELGSRRKQPPWLNALLDHFAASGRLYGHGVHYSMLSATWEARQERWLDALSEELARRPYVHFSEHYGFMTAPPFVRGAPLPPFREGAVSSVAADRLQRLRACLPCPLGVENLALAWNRHEALAHGPYLRTLLSDTDFLVLDLHNLYCQAINFALDPHVLLATFALERVRELHLSGGSMRPAWPDAQQKVRCDTHDERVPEPLFDLLDSALTLCPNLRLVVFERLGHTLRSDADLDQFRRDYQRIRATVSRDRVTAHAPTYGASPLAPPSNRDEHQLAAFQAAFLSVLAQPHHEESALRAAFAGEAALAPYLHDLAAVDGRALGIASRVVQKWARRP